MKASFLYVFRAVQAVGLGVLVSDRQQTNSMSRILLKELGVPQLFKKFPHLMEPEVHYLNHNSRPLVPILSQIHLIHDLPGYF